MIPPNPGTNIFLAGDTPQMCQSINIIDDDEIESNETFTVVFDLTILGSFMDGRFRYDPNVTEIVIIDNDEGIIVCNRFIATLRRIQLLSCPCNLILSFRC